ncbi:MAG: hypothetical protein ACFB0D_09610 [Phormidesmis sp.]
MKILIAKAVGYQLLPAPPPPLEPPPKLPLLERLEEDLLDEELLELLEDFLGMVTVFRVCSLQQWQYFVITRRPECEYVACWVTTDLTVSVSALQVLQFLKFCLSSTKESK